MPSWHRRSACGSGRDSRRGRSHHTVERHQAHDHLAALLATVGVGISVGLMTLFGYYVLGLPFWIAMLLGAVTSPTDAAAIFSVLRTVPIPHSLRGALEAESGLNDAPTVLLVMLASSFAVGRRLSSAFRVSSADRARAARRHGHRWRPWLARCTDSASRRCRLRALPTVNPGLDDLRVRHHRARPRQRFRGRVRAL